MKNKKNIFKNSGIRSLTEDHDSIFKKLIYVWTAPQNKFFTKRNVTHLAWSIGIFLQKKYGTYGNILIGTDTRSSGPWIKQRFLKTISSMGHTIFDTGIVPTPFIAQVIKNKKKTGTNDHFFQLGIIITASHNPAEYNGVKFITPDGYLTIEEEMTISQIFDHISSPEYRYKKHPEKVSFFDSFSFYQTALRKQLTPATTPSDIKIVLDCTNGATSFVAQKIFQQYYPHTISIHADGNGTLINKSPSSSDPKLLIKTVQEHNAQWGCIFDGDGDRVMIANNKGEIFDGDDILMVLSQHPKLIQQSIFVGTIMTNNAVEQYFKQHHKTFLRTDVGERNIIQLLQKYNAQLGSETCGHITVMDHAYCSDGIFTALLFFEIIFSNPEILQKLPHKFPQLHTNIPINRLAIELTDIQNLVQELNQKIYPGRIIARTSNTEPLFRLTVEHPQREKTIQITDEIKQKIVTPD